MWFNKCRRENTGCSGTLGPSAIPTVHVFPGDKNYVTNAKGQFVFMKSWVGSNSAKSEKRKKKQTNRLKKTTRTRTRNDTRKVSVAQTNIKDL